MPAPEKENEKDPSAALGITIRRGLPHFFSSRPGSQPPPFGAPPSGGRREYAAFSHRHFERKREIFFVCGQAKEARMTDHGKRRTLCGVESRCFMQTALRRKTETANEKDPSTALGMTIRERAAPFLFISLREPASRPFGAPPSGGRRECAAPTPLFPHLNTRTGWRPVRAVFLESSEWSSHKTIGL